MGKKSKKQKYFWMWLFGKIFLLLDFICSFLEMHLVKIVAFSIMALCCYMVNALHMIVVVMLLMCLIFGFSALQFSFSFIGLYLSILFLSKMVYQTKLVPEIEQSVNCSAVNSSFYLHVTRTIFDPVWWGFERLKRGESLLTYYKGYILVFFVMTLQGVIRTRQKIVRIDAGESPDTPHVIYMKTVRKSADKNLKESFKYLINYGFYKFGIEITLSFCVILIAFRMDIFSVLYAIWVFILSLPKRTTLSIIWPFFFTTLLFSILWQYTMAVGLSPKTCFEYPWVDQEALSVWMFLPSFKYNPETKKTLVDFCLLLLIQRQQSVFELEKKYGDRYYGGSNKEVHLSFKSRNLINPTPDHTLRKMNWISTAKFLCFTCFLRITLAFLFWNGASNVNVLSLGYLVGAFVFLWLDYDLCLWPTEKVLRWWNILLGYTIFVIFAKTLIEFAGCVYGDYLEKQIFWLVELFCVNCQCAKVYDNRQSNNFHWDVVCFICVIFQKRYFKSYYYLHETNDVVAIYRLQEKGAKLIDKLQEYKLKQFQERERKTLMKIKKNMNRIKAWQKRMQGLKYNEPKDHATAIYMGDYFMFEDLDKVSSSIEDSPSSSEESIESGTKQKSLRRTMSEFIGTVFRQDKRQDEFAEDWKSETSLSEEETAVKKSEKADKKREQADHLNGKDKKKKKRTRTQRSAERSFDSSDQEYVKFEKEAEKTDKCWILFCTCLANTLIFLTRFFKKYSRDYRYIQSVIKQERKNQKNKTRKSVTNERRSSSQPKDYNEENDDEEDDDDKDQDAEETKEGGIYRRRMTNKLMMNLIYALSMFIMSKTELLCYMIIFLHTVLSPTLISLPLPILVFLWGSLTSVRPTTTFWTVLIAYTEVTVVIKAVFQNSIFPWNFAGNKDAPRPGNPPLFLGIHRDNQYVTADLFLLLLLFLHRYKLKTLGLWNRTHEEETLPPQNLFVYKELHSEKDIKDLKGNRSVVHQRKVLITDPPEITPSITEFLRMAIWKCTSRVTAKVIYRGKRFKTKIMVKEIEGKILVTHEGRRLEPTYVHVSLLPENELEGKMVLRVSTSDAILEYKSLPYRLSWVQHFTSLRKFFLQIAVRDWRVSADFYTLMFIFEFLNFLIVFFGYSSFVDFYG